MNGDTMKRRKFDFSKEYGIVLEGGEPRSLPNWGMEGLIGMWS